MQPSAARPPQALPTVSLPHTVLPELEQLTRDLARSSDLDVHDVAIHTHRIPMTVQVRVNRPDGGDVSLDACAAFSGPLGDAIEAAGLLDSAYVLEVSSPGIGETLFSERDFVSFRSFPVEVLHRDARGAEVRREGLLLGRDEDAVRLNLRGRTIAIPRRDISQVRLVTPRDDR